jgi:hypothetical protein
MDMKMVDFSFSTRFVAILKLILILSNAVHFWVVMKAGK